MTRNLLFKTTFGIPFLNFELLKRLFLRFLQLSQHKNENFEITRSGKISHIFPIPVDTLYIKYLSQGYNFEFKTISLHIFIYIYLYMWSWFKRRCLSKFYAEEDISENDVYIYIYIIIIFIHMYLPLIFCVLHHRRVCTPQRHNEYINRRRSLRSRFVFRRLFAQVRVWINTVLAKLFPRPLAIKRSSRETKNKERITKISGWWRILLFVEKVISCYDRVFLRGTRILIKYRNNTKNAHLLFPFLFFCVSFFS